MSVCDDDVYMYACTRIYSYVDFCLDFTRKIKQFSPSKASNTLYSLRGNMESRPFVMAIDSFDYCDGRLFACLFVFWK